MNPSTPMNSRKLRQLELEAEAVKRAEIQASMESMRASHRKIIELQQHSYLESLALVRDSCSPEKKKKKDKD